MSGLQAVLFDLGGTLLEYLPDHETWEQLESRGIAALHRLLAEHGWTGEASALRQGMMRRIAEAWERSTSGLASATLGQLIQTHCVELGLELRDGALARAEEVYCASAGSVVRLYPGAVQTLAELKARGLKLGLISNTLWPAERHRADLARFGLLQYFDDLVFSSECGYWKPNRQVFAFALERLGLDPGRAAFVGDRLVDDVGGAQQAGLFGILRELDRVDTDYERGRQLGIRPHATVRHLAELPAALERLQG